MNEGFSIRLRRGGKVWPIDSLTKDDGLIFDNEVDAFPRSLTLEFDGVNAATTYRMPSRHRLAVRDCQDDFDGGGEHTWIMPLRMTGPRCSTDAVWLQRGVALEI